MGVRGRSLKFPLNLDYDIVWGAVGDGETVLDTFEPIMTPFGTVGEFVNDFIHFGIYIFKALLCFELEFHEKLRRSRNKLTIKFKILQCH